MSPSLYATLLMGSMDFGVVKNVWKLMTGALLVRRGRTHLLMLSVCHFLAEQQTLTVSEISNFLIYSTLNVHFNCTIVNLKQ